MDNLTKKLKKKTEILKNMILRTYQDVAHCPFKFIIHVFDPNYSCPVSFVLLFVNSVRIFLHDIRRCI